MSDPSVRLPDGTPVLIRPLTAADGAELRRGLEHLSPRSADRRFLGTAPSLTSKILRHLTDVDHVHHEALGAATTPARGPWRSRPS